MSKAKDLITGVKNSGFDYKLLYDAKSQYTPEHKVAACAMYLVLQSSNKVGQQLNIEPRTVRRWMNMPWWTELYEHVKAQHGSKLDGKMTWAMGEAMRQIEDRLVNGNPTVAGTDEEVDYDQDGRVTARRKRNVVGRIPLSGKDLTTMYGTLYDKRALQRGDPTSRVAQDGNVADKVLEDLGKKFEDLAVQAKEHNERQRRSIEILRRGPIDEPQIHIPEEDDGK